MVNETPRPQDDEHADSLERSTAWEVEPAARAPSIARPRWIWLGWINVRKIGVFLTSLFLFILAIQLMKEGARGIAPLLRSHFAINNAANSLGFGWLFAYAIFSGSPVAAAALTFFDAGAIDRLEAFAMITGSRLGASFIVLFIGFVYTLRGHERRTSLAMGLLSLAVTGSVHLAGLIVGTLLLTYQVLDFLQIGSGAILTSVVGVIFDPLASVVVNALPGWAVFIVGMGVIVVSFSLFDRALPQIRLRGTGFDQVPRLIYRPLVMFALGTAVTMICMSVSISLSILVPLSARGYIRRENVIPYIMGANISTFVDTLLAAVLLNNPIAFTVILVEIISIGLVSLLILLFAYHAYEKSMLDLVEAIGRSNRNLAVFMFTIFVIPLLLLLL